MKQIHIKELKVHINISEILNAISLNKKIEIDIDGKIYFDEKIDIKKVVIFRLEDSKKYSTIVNIKALVKNIFNDYKPLIDGNKCILNLLVAWQKIIFFEPRKNVIL